MRWGRLRAAEPTHDSGRARRSEGGLADGIDAPDEAQGTS